MLSSMFTRTLRKIHTLILRQNSFIDGTYFLVIVVTWLCGHQCRSVGHSIHHCTACPLYTCHIVSIVYLLFFLFNIILFTFFVFYRVCCIHYTKENSMYLETYLAINLIPILLNFFYYWKTSIVPKGSTQEMPWKILPLWGKCFLICSKVSQKPLDVFP